MVPLVSIGMEFNGYDRRWCFTDGPSFSEIVLARAREEFRGDELKNDAPRESSYTALVACSHMHGCYD